MISGSSGLGSLFFSVQIFFFVFRVHTVQKFSENENEKDKKDDDMCSLACIAKKKKKTSTVPTSSKMTKTHASTCPFLLFLYRPVLLAATVRQILKILFLIINI